MKTETGEGLPDSDSYADIADADAHFEARSVSRWAQATESERSAALIRATDYVDAHYLFRSVPATDTQALQCPRHEFTAALTKAKRATIELALVALDRDLFATPEREITSETKKLGTLEKSVSYATTPIASDPYPSITKLLATVATRRGSKRPFAIGVF